jgi:hypothetical protein
MSYKAVIHNSTGSVIRYGYCDFLNDYNPAIESIVDLNIDTIPPTGVPNYYCKIVNGNFVEMTTEEKAAVDTAQLSPIIPSHELTDFVNANACVTDEATGIVGPFDLMQLMLLRKEFYNDSGSPLYTSNFTPVLGSSGWAEDHGNRINNLDTIHGKLGWHAQQIEETLYYKPKDLLIYYGWLNPFNSAINGWSNEKVAQDFAKYSVLVFGDGIQDPSHGDYSNTQVIISRVKALNPNA